MSAVFPAASSDSTPPLPALDRRLGPLDGAAIVVSNVIGSGIFLVPAFVAQLVPHPWAMVAVWVAGGALALPPGLDDSGCFDVFDACELDLMADDDDVDCSVLGNRHIGRAFEPCRRIPSISK